MSDSGKILNFDIPVPPCSATEEFPVELTSDTHKTLYNLILAMKICGQDPVTQLTGYLITEDPTYLPECTRARALARHIGRDKLMEILIEEYMDHHPTDTSSSSL